MNISLLRKQFLDICQGFSKASFQGRDIYFRHVNDVLQVDLDEYEEIWRKKAIKLGTLTEDAALARAIKNKKWSKKQETNLIRQREEYDLFCHNAKFRSIKEIDGHFDERERFKKEILTLNIPRFEALGLYVEKSAAEAVYREEIRFCAFADAEFQIPFFSDFKYLDYLTLCNLESLYLNTVAILKMDSLKQIKRISCQDFFAHKFFISENPADFFQAPLWGLSQLQTFLLCYGKKFSDILPHCSGAPERFYEEPDKLECYAKMMQEKGPEKPVPDMRAQVAKLNKSRGR